MSPTKKRRRIPKKNTNNNDPIPFNERTYLRRNKIMMEHSFDSGKGNAIETIFEVFIEYLTEGNPVDVCRDLVGVSQLIYAKWIKRGELYEELVLDGQHNPMDETCYKFILAVRKAIAQSKRRHVIRLNSKSPLTDWRQSLAILERRDRQNWGRDIIAVNKEMYDPDDTFL